MGDNILKKKEEIDIIYKYLLSSNNKGTIENIKGMNKQKAEEIKKKYNEKKKLKIIHIMDFVIGNFLYFYFYL